MPRPDTDTVRQLELVKVRRLASGRCHLAGAVGLTWKQGTVFGSPATFTLAPVATLCGAVLQGQTLRIPDLPDRGYRVTCRPCLAVERVLR